MATNFLPSADLYDLIAQRANKPRQEVKDQVWPLLYSNLPWNRVVGILEHRFKVSLREFYIRG